MMCAKLSRIPCSWCARAQDKGRIDIHATLLTRSQTRGSSAPQSLQDAESYTVLWKCFKSHAHSRTVGNSVGIHKYENSVIITVLDTYILVLMLLHFIFISLMEIIQIFVKQVKQLKEFIRFSRNFSIF